MTNTFRRKLRQRYEVLQDVLAATELRESEIVMQTRRNYIVNVVTLLECYARQVFITKNNLDELLDGDFVPALIGSLGVPGDQERIHRLCELRNKIVHEDYETDVVSSDLEEIDSLFEKLIEFKASNQESVDNGNTYVFNINFDLSKR